MTVFEIELRGPAGEPVDLRRTLLSHGTFSLPPAEIDEQGRVLEVALAVPGGPPRVVRVAGGAGVARVEVAGRPGGERALEATLRRMLNMGEDLSGFYAIAADDPELAWVTQGAGRMARSPSVFEDVVKTLATTNCSWALTTTMIRALVERLGEPARGSGRRAFPTPEAMASQPERFYREVVRAGYRAPHFVALSRSVADGSLDLEGLLDPDLPHEQVEARLLALPGIGPYGAAHVALTLGRYERLILDSWTRPAFREMAGYRSQPKDSTIERRFRRYGPWAGLAFWCLLTRGWAPDPG